MSELTLIVDDPPILARCPFCGWPANICTDGSLYWGECRDCGAEGGPSETEAEAVTAWNQRTGEPS